MESANINPMEDDDDFGELYEEEGLVENSSFPPIPVPVRSQVTYEEEFDDDEEVLYGRPSPSSSQQQAPRMPSLPQQESVAEGFDLSRNDAHEDTEPGGDNEPDGVKEESEMQWNYSENDEVGVHAEASVQGDFVENTEIKMEEREDELNKDNAENPVSEPVACETDREEKAGRDSPFAPTEPPLRENVFHFEEENVLPQHNDIPGLGMVMNGVTTSIPGLSRGYDDIEEDGEGNGENWVAEGSSARQDLTPPAELAVAENQGLQEENGWDSDSEDDLQIVLNDDRAVYPNMERREWDFEEGSEDEDGDDLVIVAGGDNPIEDQEWGAEATLPFEGAVSAPADKVSPADKTGDDKGQTGKGNVGIGNAGVPRVGYGSQHYHPHYSQYKYVRPGAGSIPGGISSASGGAQNHTRHSISSGGVWAPGKGVPTTGRGDWSSSGGRGSVQRNFLSGAGMPPWSSVPGGRGFPNGFEFSLPPNKTVFDIDVDNFEEKPWRLTTIDTTDFFNFGLDEDSWKEYCRKLEQLKLEATMQSKIRVYESGRSEQEYDPDLPIELATATGRNEAYGESTQHKLSDPGSAASAGRGRGLGRGRAILPTGRAIQVEGGFGERRPSVDFRRPRFHDSDAVIEIVLRDASEDDTIAPLKAPESANDVNEREESERGEIEMGCQKQVNTESSLQTRHRESWERDDGSKKIISGGGMLPRTQHHGDGILPLPPGPPIHCQPASSAGPLFSARIPDPQHASRWSQSVKPHKGFPQIGNEYSNGSIANQDVRGGRADSYRKEVIRDSVERTEIIEIGCTMVDTEREPTPDVRCTNVEQLTVDEVQTNSRSDGQSKPNSEVKADEDTIDDDGSDHSVKRQKLSSQNESPATAAGYSHHFKVSKSGNSKAESGNSRGYSKDRGNSRDYSRGRGNGEEEMSQYRPPKRLAKEGNKLQSEEEPYYQKDYLWNSRHSNERDSRRQKSRENPNHHRDDQYLHHGDREEMYRRRVKEDRTDKPRERGEYAKAWLGKNEDMRSLREKDEDSRRRDILPKEDGLQHRDRGHDTERDDRQELLNVRKKKDEDDWRPRLDKEDIKRGEREDNIPARPEKMDDPYFRRKRDEDLLWKDRAEKVEIARDMREREDMGGEKHEKADDYRRRRKEEDLRRREKMDKDQSIRDLRDREDMGREKHERDDGYLRRKDEDLSRRERSDKDQGIRDLRDREDMHREKHERDDDSLRRKEEDLRRRERADKDEGLRDLREREDMSREKQERDDDHHLRRREEESRRRTLFDDSRARKQRDESWRRREREDEHWRKPGFEETYGRRDREEDKSMLGGRSRHHSEEKMWHGSDRERGRSREEASLSNIDKDRLKEKRRHEEQRGKVKDRVDDTSRSRHHERDDMYSSRIDRLVYDERSSRLDRSHLRYDHSGSGHSGEDQKLHWEKRSYDHRNGSASGLVDDRVRHDHALTSRRRKTEDYHTMHHEKKPSERSTEDQESGSVWGGHADRRTRNHTTPPVLSKRMHGQEMTERHASKLKRVAADDSASEEEHVKRGRSKLERWASQKERDDANKWDNDAIKHRNTPINHEESAAGKEEQTKMEWSVGTELKRKPGKERPHSREQDDHTANQECKEAVSSEPVHVADGTRSDADQSGNRQHFETVAKLEKRRERFKQPIPNEKETQKKAENETLLENETDEVKQERPARKRRWGGSSS